jgi:hypothetical protein
MISARHSPRVKSTHKIFPRYGFIDTGCSMYWDVIFAVSGDDAAFFTMSLLQQAALIRQLVVIILIFQGLWRGVHSVCMT